MEKKRTYRYCWSSNTWLEIWFMVREIPRGLRNGNTGRRV